MGIFDDAVDFVEDTADDAVDVVVDAGDEIVDTAEDIGEDVGGDVGGLLGGFVVPGLEDFVEDAGEVGEEVVDSAAEYGEDVTTTVVELGTEAYTTGTEIVDAVTEVPAEIGEEVGGVVGGAVTEVLTPVVGEEDASAVGGVAGTVAGGAVTGGASVVEMGRDALGNAITDQVGETASSVLGSEAGGYIRTEAEIIDDRAKGEGYYEALRDAGIDPGEEAGDLVHDATRPLVGEDGADALGRFAQADVDAYGDDASAALDDSGNPDYSGDTDNPYHVTQYSATKEQRAEFEEAARGATSEVVEAVAEPLVGQEAAEAIGAVAPKIAYEVIKTVASGGASSAQEALSLGLTGYEAAVGEPLEQTVGNAVTDGLSDDLGPHASHLLGQLTSMGVSTGLNALTGQEDAPSLDGLDSDQAIRLGVKLGSLTVAELSGMDANSVEALATKLQSGEVDQETAQLALKAFGKLAPDEVQPFVAAGTAVIDGHPEEVPAALGGLLPPEVQPVVQGATDLLRDGPPSAEDGEAWLHQVGQHELDLLDGGFDLTTMTNPALDELPELDLEPDPVDGTVDGEVAMVLDGEVVYAHIDHIDRPGEESIEGWLDPNPDGEFPPPEVTGIGAPFILDPEIYDPAGNGDVFTPSGGDPAANVEIVPGINIDDYTTYVQENQAGVEHQSVMIDGDLGVDTPPQDSGVPAGGDDYGTTAYDAAAEPASADYPAAAPDYDAVTEDVAPIDSPEPMDTSDPVPMDPAPDMAPPADPVEPAPVDVPADVPAD